MRCKDFKPDHNGECLNCDEWADAHQWIVEVVCYGEPEKVERRMGPMSFRHAERIEASLNINLDHERYFTRQVPG